MKLTGLIDADGGGEIKCVDFVPKNVGFCTTNEGFYAKNDGFRTQKQHRRADDVRVGGGGAVE